MSIANLFSPNDYNLYCKTITSASGSSLNTNIIDTINPGDALQIGPVKAGVVQISHAGAQIVMNDIANGTRFNAPVVGVASGPMTIGTSSNNLIMGAGGGILIDRFAPVTPADFLSVGTTNSGVLNLGRTGGGIAVNTGITWAAAASLGGGSISYFENMATINATCGGCIPATANFIRIEGYRMNNVVYLRIRPTSATIAATVASPLTVASALTANFLPIGNCRFSVGLIGSGNADYPGVFSIATSGVMSFQFMGSTHGASTQWAIGEACNVLNLDVSYAVI